MSELHQPTNDSHASGNGELRPVYRLRAPRGRYRRRGVGNLSGSRRLVVPRRSLARATPTSHTSYQEKKTCESAFVNTSTQEAFIGRHGLLFKYFQQVHNFLQNRNTRFFFHIYAITGMGKTWLIWMLFLAIHESQRCQSYWISLSAASDLPPLHEPPNWLSRVLHYRPHKPAVSFEPQTMPARKACAHVLAQFGLTASEESLTTLLGDLEVSAVLPEPQPSLGRPDVLVLFLDGLDLLEQQAGLDSRAVWEALQLHLLLPLYLTGKVLCFTTGQAPMVWRYFDLARVVQDDLLPGLTAPELQEMAQSYKLEPLANDIGKVAQGHPFLSRQLFQQAQKQLEDESARVDLPAFEATAEPLPGGRVDTISDDLAPLARALLPAAALLRSLELDALAEGLRTVPLVQPQPVRQADLISSLGAYLAAGLLVERSAPLQYAWRHDLRPVLELLARAELTPEQRRDLHCTYAGWYQREIERDPQRYGFLLSEWMYQSLSALSAGERPAEGEAAWALHFRRLWWLAGGPQSADEIRQDRDIQRALAEWHYQQAVLAILDFVPNYQRQRPELYQKTLEYLRKQRIARGAEQLDADDLALLRDLVQQKKFDVPALRALIGQHYSPPRSEAEVPLGQAIDTMDRLTATYVVEYDSARGGFVVEPWLRQVLCAWSEEAEGGHSNPRR